VVEVSDLAGMAPGLGVRLGLVGVLVSPWPFHDGLALCVCSHRPFFFLR